MPDRSLETVVPPSLSSLDPAYLIHAYEHRAYPLLADESFWIGRSSQCDIMVSEVFVSRQHAEIRTEGSEFVIHPVGSTPTLVNDTAIHHPKILREGDVIHIGTMRFVYTRERLPVAMTIADPWIKTHRLYDEISDRRPTLTFPVQTVAEIRVGRPRTSLKWMWLVLAALAAIGFAYLVMGYYAAT
jgi:hypothetical protein